MSCRIVFDHRGAPVRRTRRRTWLSLLDTFLASARVLARPDSSPERIDRVVSGWAARCFRTSRTTLVAEGLEHVQPGRAYVIVSNHASLLDIPAILGTFPGRVRFVAKQELRAVPAFGRAMERAGIVFVDRSDRARAIQQLGSARQLVHSGTSVWVAAEGTRTRDRDGDGNPLAPGTLGRFKKGAFHIALGLGVPILPTWIEGTGRVLPPDGFTCLTGQTVTVRYGEPVPTEGCGRADLDHLVATTRARIVGLATRNPSRSSTELAGPDLRADRPQWTRP